MFRTCIDPALSPVKLWQFPLVNGSNIHRVSNCSDSIRQSCSSVSLSVDALSSSPRKPGLLRRWKRLWRRFREFFKTNWLINKRRIKTTLHVYNEGGWLSTNLLGIITQRAEGRSEVNFTRRCDFSQVKGIGHWPPREAETCTFLHKLKDREVSVKIRDVTVSKQGAGFLGKLSCLERSRRTSNCSNINIQIKQTWKQCDVISKI